MLDLGELLLHIRVDSSEAEKGVSTIGDKLGSGLKTAAGVAVAAIGAATAAVTGFAASSVSVGMDFDKAMSQVAATMGKTTDEIQNLRDFALEMGSTTSFSASQAAEALNYMALAGYDADQSMAMLPNVLNLAAAGNMDLARASDMVTDAQSALGLTLEQTTVMVDQWAKTSSTTNTSVEQLGDAFLTVGATAASLKIPTEEMAQVLGILADNSIKGSEGGTHYRNMLLSLANPTDKAKAQLDALGVAVFDSTGEMRSMEDIIKDLNVALGDMTDEQRTQAIGAIFNKTDLAAVNALLNTNTERWGEVAAAIDDAKDSAQTMADTQLDNLAGDIVKFKSALEGAQIAISDGITPTLREFVQFGTGAISTLSDAFKEGGLAGAMDALGTILSDGLNMVISKLPEMVDAGMKLLGALGQGLLDNLPTITDSALKIVQTIVEGLVQAFPSLAQGAVDIITQLATGIGQALPNLIPAAVEAITTFATSLTSGDNIGNIIDAALDLITGLVEGITNALPLLVEAAPQIISGLISGIISHIPDILECGVQILKGLLQGIVQSITLIPATIKGVFDGIVNGIKSLFGIHSPSTVMAEIGKFVIQGMLQGITNAWKGITEFFSGAIKGVVDFVSKGWETLKTKTGEAWDAIKTKAGELKEKVSEHWENLKTAVVDKAKELGEKATEKWENLKKNVTEKAQEILKNGKEKFEELKKNVTEKVQDLKEKATEKFNDLAKNVTDKAKEIAEKGKEKFEEFKKNATDKFEEAKKNVKEKWEAAVKILKDTDLKSIGKTVVGNFKAGLEGAWSTVTSWVSGAAKGIKDTISGAINWVSSKISGSHRTGLGEVPYDGYVAELHRGERVLTAAETNQYDQFRKGQQQPQTAQTIIKFEGNYQFANQQDIDYFMNEAGKLIRRKVG